MKKIVLGADHGGYELKNIIKAHLEARGFEAVDVGTNSGESCDYPVFASRLCAKIQSGEADLGILVCGTGIGMSMAANKHKGIRAACCENTFSARMTRAHNDTNILCLGARVIGCGLALDMIDLFIETEFMGDRHQKRVDMLNALDN